MRILDSYILEKLRSDLNKGTNLLYDRYYKPLVLFAESFIADLNYSEDLVQDVFCKFIEKRIYLEINQNALSTYLFKTVRNICIDKKREDKKYTFDNIERIKYEIIEEENKTISPTLVQEVLDEINNLPHKTRIIVTEIIVNHKKYKEVAEELNVSVNTVKTLLKNGLKQIREKFSEQILILFLLNSSEK